MDITAFTLQMSPSQKEQPSAVTSVQPLSAQNVAVSRCSGLLRDQAPALKSVLSVIHFKAVVHTEWRAF